MPGYNVRMEFTTHLLEQLTVLDLAAHVEPARTDVAVAS